MSKVTVILLCKRNIFHTVSFSCHIGYIDLIELDHGIKSHVHLQMISFLAQSYKKDSFLPVAYKFLCGITNQCNHREKQSSRESIIFRHVNVRVLCVLEYTLNRSKQSVLLMIYCSNRPTDDGIVGTSNSASAYMRQTIDENMRNNLFATRNYFSLALDGTIASRLLFHEELDPTSHQSQRKFLCILCKSSSTYICMKF